MAFEVKQQGSSRVYFALQLIEAIHAADPMAVKLLVQSQNGCLDRDLDRYGWRAIHFAAASGHAAVVDQLLSLGADVHHVSRKGNQLALHLAANRGHAHATELLLAKGADPNVRNGEDWTALQLAAANGHAACVKSLLTHMADPTLLRAPLGSALHMATIGGFPLAVAVLLANGGDPHQVDSSGKTPLDVCTVEVIAKRLRDAAEQRKPTLPPPESSQQPKDTEPVSPLLETTSLTPQGSPSTEERRASGWSRAKPRNTSFIYPPPPSPSRP